MKRSASHNTGFTIVEMVVTIVILAIALAGVAAMVSLGSSNSADTLLETRATALAYAYLDEIRGRRFDERSARSGLNPCFDLLPGGGGRHCTAAASFGTDGGETSRDEFDDVDDYHLLAEGDGETTPIQDAEGNTRPEYANFRVEISVSYAGMDPAVNLGNDTFAKLITVTVQNRSQDVGWAFSMYKGNY